VTVRIANAAGAAGDQPDSARRLVEHEEVDYLTLRYLNGPPRPVGGGTRPGPGHVPDFPAVVRTLCPAFYLQGQLKLVTDAGATDPRACAEVASRILSRHGSDRLPVAAVVGGNILDSLEELLRLGCPLAHARTGQPLHELHRPIVTAHVHLGANPIAAALAAGARLVITGWVAPAALAIGPAAVEHGWDWDNWACLAGAAVAGHLLGRGTHVAGAGQAGWEDVELASVGYPIAEIDGDGQATITKEGRTGGAVTRETVVQQLVSAIGDPAHYETPDVGVDLTTVDVEQRGPDCVRVHGSAGHPAPPCYDASLAYQVGYAAAAQLLVWGTDCLAKAKASATMALDRVRQAGFELERTYVGLLGTGDAVPGVGKPPEDLREVVLYVAAQDPRREAVARFLDEMASLPASGPPGLAPCTGVTGRVRPALVHWPTRVPKELIEPTVILRSAGEWAADGPASEDAAQEYG